jgi:hypothetical protein
MEDFLVLARCSGWQLVEMIHYALEMKVTTVRWDKYIKKPRRGKDRMFRENGDDGDEKTTRSCDFAES